MVILKEFLHHTTCSYLAGKEEILHYKIIQNSTKEELEEFIELGYRRFGKMFFRPVCPTCSECKSLKVDVRNFQWSKSKRRILNRAKELEIHLQKPSMSKEHLALFEKYHLYKKEKNNWDYEQVTQKGYYHSFVEGAYDFGYEVLYFWQKKLIAVDLIDILPSGISSIYCYYDPDFNYYNLGKLSLYYQIILAKENNLAWIYLGYYVKECPSLAYKAEYKPYKLLKNRPDFLSEALWQ